MKKNEEQMKKYLFTPPNRRNMKAFQRSEEKEVLDGSNTSLREQIDATGLFTIPKTNKNILSNPTRNTDIHKLTGDVRARREPSDPQKFKTMEKKSSLPKTQIDTAEYIAQIEQLKSK